MGGTTALALTGASLLVPKSKAKTQDPSYDYQQQAAEIERQKQADAQQRTDALEKVSSAQRAQFAAMGLNPSDGSSGAVLEGLQKKTTQDLNDRAAAYDAKLESARTTFAQAQAINLEPKKSSSDLLLSDDNALRLLKDWS